METEDPLTANRTDVGSCLFLSPAQPPEWALRGGALGGGSQNLLPPTGEAPCEPETLFRLSQAAVYCRISTEPKK